MKQLTAEQAKAFAESDVWKEWDSLKLALFQMQQDRLCVPFGVFHKALGEALGRPVWTHEIGANYDGLRAELEGKAPAPSFEEIVAMLPADKTVVVSFKE